MMPETQHCTLVAQPADSLADLSDLTVSRLYASISLGRYCPVLCQHSSDNTKQGRLSSRPSALVYVNQSLAEGPSAHPQHNLTLTLILTLNLTLTLTLTLTLI